MVVDSTIPHVSHIGAARDRLLHPLGRCCRDRSTVSRLVRYLYRNPTENADITAVDRAIAVENKLDRAAVRG
jgi:hypothetical protein